MMSLDQVLLELQKLGDPDVKKIKEGFAISAANSHGIFLKDLDALAKRIGKNDALALQLFDSGIYEAKLLCSRLFDPRHVTEPLVEHWVLAFENWEICDTFCMSFLGKTSFAYAKALEWAEYQPEYQKRAGFVLMVAYAFTDKDASNETIRQFFPILLKHATDPRKYVSKGINWALRQIGKRNRDLYAESIEIAQQLLALDSKSTRWIATDALRQLRRPKIAFKNYPRQLYGKTASKREHPLAD